MAPCHWGLTGKNAPSTRRAAWDGRTENPAPAWAAHLLAPGDGRTAFQAREKNSWKVYGQRAGDGLGDRARRGREGGPSYGVSGSQARPTDGSDARQAHGQGARGLHGHNAHDGPLLASG